MLTLALTLAASIASTPAGEAYVLGPTGLGKVKIGMTTRQAERVLGTKLKLTSDEDASGECLRGGRADGVDPGVVYMALKGVIQRIDVELAREPTIIAPEGIGAGATAKEVQSKYGARAKLDESDPNADPATNEDLVVDEPNHKSGLRFEFGGGKLAWIIAGNYPALSYYEGCL